MDEQTVNQIATDVAQAAAEVTSQDTAEQKVSTVADLAQDALAAAGVTVTDDQKASAVDDAQEIVSDIKQKKLQSPVLWISLIMLAFLSVEIGFGIDLSKWTGFIQLAVPLVIGGIGVFNNPDSKAKF